MNKLSMGVFRCSSVSEILKYIRAITSHRAPIKYGAGYGNQKRVPDEKEWRARAGSPDCNASR